FDLTHTLTKDASIVASRSEHWRERILGNVLSPSVEIGLSYFERGACKSRRGFNGVELVEGDGFSAALFDHTVARAVEGKLDPNAHRHCVIFNTTRGPDGQLRTPDGDQLYHHAKTAAALSSIEEAYQLQRSRLNRLLRQVRLVEPQHFTLPR